MTTTRYTLLTASELKKYLQVSDHVLIRWEQERLLVPYRTPGGHKRYALEEVRAALEASRER